MVDVTPSDRDPTIDELMMILKGEVRIGAGMTGVMDEAYNHLENYRQLWRDACVKDCGAKKGSGSERGAVT